MRGPTSPAQSRVFVLRLWREQEGDAAAAEVWRCSLENPATRQRRGFAGVEELTGYLTGLTAAAASSWRAAAPERESRPVTSGPGTRGEP